VDFSLQSLLLTQGKMHPHLRHQVQLSTTRAPLSNQQQMKKVVVVLILDRGYLQLLQHVRKSKEEEEEEGLLFLLYIHVFYIHN
jgi:hypothetical protein